MKFNLSKLLFLQFKRSLLFRLKLMGIVVNSFVWINILFLIMLAIWFWPGILGNSNNKLFSMFQAPIFILLVVFVVQIFLSVRTNTVSYSLITTPVKKRFLVMFDIVINIINPVSFLEIIFVVFLGLKWGSSVKYFDLTGLWYGGLISLIINLELMRLVVLQYLIIKKPYYTILILFVFMSWVVLWAVAPSVFMLHPGQYLLYFGLNSVAVLFGLLRLTYLLIKRTFFIDFAISK